MCDEDEDEDVRQRACSAERGLTIDVDTKIEALWNGQGMELRPEGFARVGHSSGEGRVAARVASLHPPTPAMLPFTFPVWPGLTPFRTSNRSNESQSEAPRTRRGNYPLCS